METWDAIRARRNVRQYTDQPIAREDLERICEAGRRAPSAGNGQPWDFVVVTDRAQLIELAKVWEPGGRHIAQSAATIALVAREPEDERQRGLMLYDFGQATAYMMLAAADAGIGSGHSAVADQQQAQRVLGFPDGYLAVYLIGLGYPAGRSGRSPGPTGGPSTRWSTGTAGSARAGHVTGRSLESISSMTARRPGSRLRSRAAVLGRREGLSVESGPLWAPPGFRVGDLPDEPLDERGLGVQQGEPVLLLDEEQRGHALGEGARDDGLDLGALRGQPGEPLPEQLQNLAGRQRADQRERGHEVRVLVLRLLHQLAQPVVQLGPARVGDGVDGPLRALPLAAGLLRGHEPSPFQLLDHHVQGAVVELDAPLVAMVPQCAAQLVGVHRPLRQVRQHGEREQVAYLAFLRHLLLRGACRPGRGGTRWPVWWVMPRVVGYQDVRAGSSTVGKPPSLCARRRSSQFARENMAASMAMPPRRTRI